MKISAYFLISNFLAPHSFKIQLQPRDIQANWNNFVENAKTFFWNLNPGSNFKRK